MNASPIIDEAVPAAVAETGRLFESLGHTVGEAAPDWGLLAPNFITRYLCGIRDEVRLTPRPERLERRTRGYARLAAGLTDGLLRRAIEGEAADRRRFAPFFEEHDVLMMPVIGTTAVPVRRWEGRGALWSLNGEARIYPWTGAFNHLGFPAAAVPAGFAPDGLPLSVQLVAPFGREDLLLSLAAQLEQARPWADKRPPVS
jgi:amidase